MQDAAFSSSFDYEPGSPHLSHTVLRTMVVRRLETLVHEVLAQDGRCRVLEVGAGHGSFTEVFSSLGAEVVVTEMSSSSARLLETRFRHNLNVSVMFDPDGEEVFKLDQPVDVVACISVLHHIPDYLDFVTRIVNLIRPRGNFVSYQDPLWYPRRAHWDRGIDRGAYLLWRIQRGEFGRGIQTRIRRLRRVYDESNPSDMVEYHVVRRGVDEHALRDLLLLSFDDVSTRTYWSTQSHTLQRAGARWAPVNTFGLEARRRKSS
jgi:SAM-dependent methyltransferase